jgi:hypothetical protein
MADDKRGFLGVLAGVVALLTALVGLYSALQHRTPIPTTGPEDTQQHRARPADTQAEPQPQPHQTEPQRPAQLSGAWQLTGALQNGTSFSGQAYLYQNGRFETGAQGVTSSRGTWSADPESRTLHLEGSHTLYGTPATFSCTLTAEAPSASVFQGTCTDFAGTGTLQLIH